MRLCTRWFRVVACVVLGSFGASVILPAQAAMVETQTLLAAPVSAVDPTDRLAQALQRSDVRAQLQALGVDPADVERRVASLTPEELAQLHERIGELPAGGTDILGVLVLLLIVFVITDMLGATDIFPWVHPITK
jgi:hypothetical protein